jgi:hypothetical protein
MRSKYEIKTIGDFLGATVSEICRALPRGSRFQMIIDGDDLLITLSRKTTRASAESLNKILSSNLFEVE